MFGVRARACCDRAKTFGRLKILNLEGS